MPTADHSSLSPEVSSRSDSDPELYEGAAGEDPDFASAARAGLVYRPKDSKTKLREKNKRAQKRFRARQKVLLTISNNGKASTPN